jgi:hypothetical protein
LITGSAIGDGDEVVPMTTTVAKASQRGVPTTTQKKIKEEERATKGQGRSWEGEEKESARGRQLQL